jgi:hypothetical protein
MLEINFDTDYFDFEIITKHSLDNIEPKCDASGFDEAEPF